MRTIGQMMDAMVNVATREEAAALVENEIEHALQETPSYLREEARDVVMKYIGYLTGYLNDRKEAGRLLELFGTRHPYFGAIEEWPTPEKTYAMGVKVGERVKAGRRS